jgi:hypothetical protein
MKGKVLIISTLFVFVITGVVSASTWMIKQDVLQPFDGERCAFESVLAGADADRIFDGGSEGTSNGFATPWWMLDGQGGSTRVTWTGNRVLNQSSSVRHSFGAAGNGPMPKVANTYWRNCPRDVSTDIDIVPGVSIDSISNPFSNVSMVTFSNTTNEAIYINNISYLNRRNIELEDMNHDILRRGLFQEIDILPDMQLLIGESFSFPVKNARRTDFLIMKFDVEFAVSSERDNLYKGTVEEWFAFRQLDENPTTIHSFDINDNLFIDDHEFFKALDKWTNSEISDSLFFATVDAWVQRVLIQPASVEPASLDSFELSSSSAGITFGAQGDNIATLGVEIYALGGQSIYAATSRGSRLNWNRLTASGQSVANGVYLYVVNAYGQNGDIVSSEISKLVILN